MSNGGVIARFHNIDEEEPLKMPFYHRANHTIDVINKFCQCEVVVDEFTEVSLTGHATKTEVVSEQYQWDPAEDKPLIGTNCSCHALNSQTR